MRDRTSLRTKLVLFFASCGFLGFTPVFPGTTTSLFAVVVWYLLAPQFSLLSHAMLLIVLFFLGVVLSRSVEIHLKAHDPSCIVIDELVGMWLALYGIGHHGGWYLVAFLFFRFFDIAKVLGVGKVERLPYGWGVMLDDVIAGLLTCTIIHGLRWGFSFV